MDIRVELLVRINNKMAIPFPNYVPPPGGLGLPPLNGQLGPVQQVHQIHPQAPIDVNNNQFVVNMHDPNNRPDLLNNQPHPVGLEPINNPVSFIRQLIMELWGVFMGDQPQRPRLYDPRNRGKYQRYFFF